MEHREKFIQALRDCADFLESHPGVAAPRYITINAFVNTREELVAQAKAATWEKSYFGDWFALSRRFSEHLSLEITADRSVVCRKVVTGTRVVPAKPEETVEVFEWRCDEASVLASPESVEA